MHGAFLRALIPVHKAGARVKDAPDVVDDFAVRAHHVKVEPVRVLAFEVAQQGLAESRSLHHTTHSFALEESVELCNGTVKGLGQRAALQVKVHLLRAGGAVAGGIDQSGELLGVECGVLDGSVGKPVD